MPVWVIVAAVIGWVLAIVLTIALAVVAGRSDRRLEEQRARRALQSRRGEWDWPDHG
jgi:type II secretory pathway pseudopilin PulG